MMTNDNYSTPKKYKVEAAAGCLYDKENNLTDTAAYIQGNTALAFEDTDMSKTENANENTTARRSRTRRSRDQIADESPRNSEELQVEGATAQAEKPKSSKKEKPSGKKRKDRKNLREKRRSTGVVIMPGLGNDEQADEAKQTMENTKMNESIGTEEYSPSPSEVSTSSTPSRSSRLARDDVDVDRQEKQDLLDRIEKLEKALEQKTKEVETLEKEKEALLRVVQQVKSLQIK
ncbi:uncharacterized protein LOC114531795 isoform X1 [Dendronephthya gigantea]|uniref:uncharacterized protein LOC114531795 isoform X1 n=1 Tax=Dendronephthya gigantea TaxID=151771 RepID=UPI00106B82C4|nr:uncharacterized protein LOC114531795 isoform X1 [Dendronephthya gigantea]